MKILAVCGMGIGTSVLLKSNAERAVQDLGLDADVEVADIGSARGAASTADLVLTSSELASELEGLPVAVKVVDNFIDAEEVRRAIEEATAG